MTANISEELEKLINEKIYHEYHSAASIPRIGK